MDYERFSLFVLNVSDDERRCKRLATGRWCFMWRLVDYNNYNHYLQKPIHNR
jgi:hypothetical protein